VDGRVIRRVLAGTVLAAAAVVGLLSITDDPISGLWYLAYLTAGSVLVIRRPTNPVGWLLLLIMIGFMGTTDLSAAQVAAMETRTAAPMDAIRIWLGAMSGVCVFAGFGGLAMVLPTGRLPTGRWRAGAIALLATNAVLAIVTAVAPRMSVTVDAGARTIFVPNPLAIAPDAAVWTVIPDADIAFLPVLVILAVGVASIVVRYRRATGLLRLQLRWLVAALTFTVSAVCAGFLIILVGGDAVGWFAWLPATAAFVTIPLAIMVSVLRYRLLEIDRIVSRTIGWALATGVLAALFVAGTLLLQTLLAGLTQGDTIAVAASTLAAAALFQPVRSRVQRAVDRRFDRSRYDRDLAATAFGRRLRDELDLTMLRTALLETSDAVVRPMSSALWLRPRERSE
jgi:hypothetical protein